MARAASARDAVTTLLARLLDAHPLQLTVVLTLRTDFEPQFDRSALAAGWNDARFVVPPMSRADLKAVIEQPASARVLYFDPPALVETLLDDVVNTPGGLPLLSFALSEMFGRYVARQAADRALTAADYDAIGGVAGALRARADAEYEALDADHRAAMQRLMLRMVGGGAGSLVKRRVSDAELEFTDPAERARVHEVLRRLTEARLVVEGPETDGARLRRAGARRAGPRLEPAHRLDPRRERRRRPARHPAEAGRRGPRMGRAPATAPPAAACSGVTASAAPCWRRSSAIGRHG